MANKKNSPQVSPTLRIVRRVVLLLVFVMLVLVVVYTWPFVQTRFQTPGSLAAQFDTPHPEKTATPSPSSTFHAAVPPEDANTSAPPTAFPASYNLAPFSDQGLIVLSIGEGLYTHLFAYQAQDTPFVRLTGGPWHDITPTFSPDGTRLAFASNRDGQWDLYEMDLTNGDTKRLTNTPEYDASPSWSPDGLWLVYETYIESEDGPNLELYIMPLSEGGKSIRLTENPASDFSPSWSPQGRHIAFVSTRTGDNEIWLADLDEVDERFKNVSHNKNAFEIHPAWSSDGSQLAWSASSTDGLQNLFVWDFTQPDKQPYTVHSGDWFSWSPRGDALLTSINTPNQTYLTGYSLPADRLILPMLALSGPVGGMTWGPINLLEDLPAALASAAQITPTPLWIPIITPVPDLPSGRMRIVPLNDVEAPNPMLQDLVDESFNSLRQRVIAEAGWDFMASLENAFVPLTAPLGPSTAEDWLYTGRAFTFNTAPVTADWVLIMREDYGPTTYWRIYLRTRFQDGTQGTPLKVLSWDINARHAGDPRAYEQGGKFSDNIPSGYWIDFTRLAAAYSWDRLPALNTWRLAYSTSRFNRFAFTSGLDWLSAMMEIYPREALNTTTPVPSPTNTPTITLTPTRTKSPTPTRWLSPTPSITPTITLTRTPRPTNTPWPTVTPWFTRSPTPTSTPSLLEKPYPESR